MILIPLLIMTFAIIDFGRLIQARLVVTNLSREGGSLASRDIESAGDLITMLQHGSSPLDIATNGKIYIWKIRAGASADSPDPFINYALSANRGALHVDSSVDGQPDLGLSPQIYNHLVFDPDNQMADISEVTVVEVFYKYTPITPISNVIRVLDPTAPPLLAGDTIIKSRAVF